MAAVLSTSGKITKGAYVSDWVDMGNGMLVHRYSICGTDVLDYSVWEPRHHGMVDGKYTSTHSTITHHDDMALGDVCTRDLPPVMDALPAGDARIRAVVAWYDANKAMAHAIILAAYPADFE